MAGIEVAQATITVTPVLEGAQSALQEQLTGAAGGAGAAAGTTAGAAMGASFSKGMTSAGKGLTAAVTAPIVGIGAAAVKSWQEVDAGLDTIVQKTGASGEVLEGMRGVLESVVTSIPTDFETAGAAIGEVNTRFSLTGKELESLSGSFVKFAKLNNQDVSRSVDSVSKMMAAFGVETEDAGKMLDLLNTVGQQSGEDVGGLADLMAANAKQFQEMGLSVEEAAGFIGEMSLAGLDSSTAMLGLKTAMKNATEDGKSLDEVLADFQNTMDSNASESDKLAEAYEIFGTRAGAAIENAVSNGQLSLDDFTTSLGDFEGSVNDTFDNTTGPMEGFQTTLNELKIAGMDLVEAAGPALTDMLGGLADIISKASDAWSGLSPEMQEFLIKAAGIAALVGPLLIIGGKVIGGISAIGDGIGGLIGNIGGLGGAATTAAGPVASAGASFGTMAGGALQIIAVAGGFLLVAFGLKLIADAAISLTNAGGPAIAVFFGMIGAIAGLMGVAALLGPALTAGAIGIGVFGAAMLAIGGGIDLACQGIAKVTEAITGLVDVVLSHSEEINSIVTTIGDTVNGTITTISDGISGIIDSLSGGISGVLDSVAGVIDSIGEAALNAGTGFEKLADAVMNLVNNTGVLDLGATLGTVATGVKDISKAAGEAGSGAASVNSLANGLKSLVLAGTAAGTSMTNLDKTTKASTTGMANAFRGMNLAAGMRNAMNGAIQSAAAGISQLRSMFANTRFSFNQHIAVPHFSMSGDFNAQTKAVPSITTRWYAKAAEYGALFTTPTIIGVGDASQPEILLGENKLKELVKGGTTVNNYITVNGAEEPEAYASRLAKQIKLEMRMA